jgi:hypothetical protein
MLCYSTARNNCHLRNCGRPNKSDTYWFFTDFGNHSTMNHSCIRETLKICTSLPDRSVNGPLSDLIAESYSKDLSKYVHERWTGIATSRDDEGQHRRSARRWSHFQDFLWVNFTKHQLRTLYICARKGATSRRSSFGIFRIRDIFRIGTNWISENRDSESMEKVSDAIVQL